MTPGPQATARGPAGPVEPPALERREQTLGAWCVRAYRLNAAPPGAPRLAFVHGLEGSWDNWTALRGGAFESFELWALDLPWNGLDGYYWCHARPAREWLELALELLPEAPAVLVAHSYGVNVVLDYLQRGSPSALRALVLISAFYRPDFRENDWRLFQRCLDGFRAILSQGIRLRRAKALEAELLASMVEKVLDHVGPVGFSECFSHFARTPDLDLRRVSWPTLVLAGALDPGATPAGNSALAAGLPDGRLELFPDLGHFCMLEDPRRVTEAVHGFLVARQPELVASPVAGAAGARWS